MTENDKILAMLTTLNCKITAPKLKTKYTTDYSTNHSYGSFEDYNCVGGFYSSPENCVCYNGPLKQGHYVIGFNLPGLSKEEIDISVTDSGFSISTKPKAGSHLTKKEIKVPFSASFDTKLAKAKIQNGVLELSVPLKPVKGADKILVE